MPTLIAVSVTTTVAYQLGEVIAGEDFSVRYPLGSIIATVTTMPLLDRVSTARTTSLETAATMIYAAGVHSFIQGFLMQPGVAKLTDADDIETVY